VGTALPVALYRLVLLLAGMVLAMRVFLVI